MKKRLLFILLSCVCSCVTAQVQHIDKKLVNNKLNFACNFFDNSVKYIPPSSENITDEDAETWMRGMINQIMGVVGLQNRYRLLALTNYNNCSAVCLNNNIGQDRFIQFDKAFLQAYQKKTNNKWFVLGVLAHEIGHHLNGHSLQGVGSRPNKEIEADEFAGFIMQKLGASLDEAQGVFSFLNNTEGPPSHPVKAKRYDAIKRGWDNAAGKMSYQTLVFNEADIKDFAFSNLLMAKKQADPYKALSYIDRALRNVPAYAEAVSEKGLIYLEIKQLDSAFYYCNEAVKMEPYIALLRLNLARVFYQAKDLQQAAAFIDDAIFLRPVFSSAYYAKALLQVDQKKFMEAGQSCDFALATQPDNDFDLADILETKGITLYETGKQKEALQYFAAAKKLNPVGLNIGSYLEARQKGK